MKSRKALRHKRRLSRTNQTLRKYKRQRGGAFGFPQLSKKNAKYAIVTITPDVRDEDSLETTMTLEQAEDILEDTQMN
jgi:hypothetical protein